MESILIHKKRINNSYKFNSRKCENKKCIKYMFVNNKNKVIFKVISCFNF